MKLRLITALIAATALSLRDGPGAIRIGLSHYNSPAEVDRLLTALFEIAAN